METIDFSKYTVKGLQKMAKDAGIKGMSKATAGPISEALSEADLSKLDMDSYPMKKVTEDKPKATKPPVNPIASKAVSPRRTIRKGSFGRR